MVPLTGGTMGALSGFASAAGGCGQSAARRSGRRGQPTLARLLAIAGALLLLGASRPFALPTQALQEAPTRGNSWDTSTGQHGLTTEDIARLRLVRGANTFALTTEDDLEQLLKMSAEGGRILVVDYYAPWCRACQRLLQQIQKLAAEEEYNDVYFASVDFERSRELCKAKNVDKLPTLEIYRGDQLEQRYSGASKKRLLEELAIIMGKAAQRGVAAEEQEAPVASTAR